jgi:hypothetical protein
MSHRLYHGTSAKHLASILSSGLAPRAESGHEGYWEVESAEDRVYLTSAYAPFYAMQAADKDKSLPIILEIDYAQLDESRLLPDEDYLEQTLRLQYENGQDTLWMELGGDMASVTKYFREHAPYMANRAEDSLARLGTCAYKGLIPASSIRRVAVIEEGRSHLIEFSDPSICLMNYLIMGTYYRNLSGKMVEGESYILEEDELFGKQGSFENLKHLNISRYTPDQFDLILRSEMKRPLNEGGFKP